ncbi:adenosylmethionine--8-amino-7-oxononanoate transaminase [Microbacterium sp. X-17]|uniref:adenosylmethionine--8-amino-7-oxononanoate transaminase n=1 Tax=Microbacterium sp. X-17 TaxID=3144404 RepID=UPI0031F52564
MPDGGAGATVLERDRELVWHPYARLEDAAAYEVTAADGVTLTLSAPDGTTHEVIDGMSSWWSAIHGYRHAELDAALTAQAGRFSHVMFGGLTHEPAVGLAERLVTLTPAPLQHVFFADSGSVSVEVALKLALQYQTATGRAGRRRFVALRGGYHGDTAGAMAVSDPVDGMHAAFPGHLAVHLFLPRPPAARLRNGELVSDPEAVSAWVAVANELFERHAHEAAGIIVEPVLQGAGGMHVYAPECLIALRRLADRHGILLIFDEIATGFGRTGRLFGADWADVTPDVMCVGKALTGGYLTLAAMICRTEVAQALATTPHGVLLHGPTFMANPLATATASASLDLLGRGEWPGQVAGIQDALADTLAPARDIDGVRDVRVLGAVGVIELDRPVDLVRVTRTAVEHGAWLRPFRNLVYTMPPYLCTTADAETIGRSMVAAVAGILR